MEIDICVQHRIQRLDGGGGARNTKSMWSPLAAIFFMTYFYRAGGGMAPSSPPGSATGVFLCFMFIKTKKGFTYLFHTIRNMMYGHFCFEAESVPSGFRAVKR